MARRSEPVTESDIDNMTDEEIEASLAADANVDVDAEAEQPEAETPAEPEPETEEGPEDEAAAEASDEDDADEPGKQETVPHGRFHHERERRQKAEERAERLEQRLEEIITRIGQGKQETPQPEQAQPAEPPDLNEDPAGYIKYLAEQNARLEGRLTEYQQTQQQSSEIATVLQASNVDMEQYAQERPEAKDAYAFLADAGRQHLAEQGIRDPMKQAAELNAWQARIAQTAQGMGIRPAALLMTMAQENGWKPTPAANPAPAKPSVPDVAAKIDAEESNRAKARQMRTGAPVDTGTLTAQQVADMSEKEWNDLIEKQFGGDPDALEAALLAG